MTQLQNKLIKYPKIFYVGSTEVEELLNLDEPVVCQSKIDGANFRCRYKDATLIFGSRKQELLYDTDPIKWKAIGAYKEALLNYRDNFIEDVIYMSESMQPHTLIYDNIPRTIGFDVYNLKEERFYDWKDAKKMFESIGIPFINVHFERKGKEISTEELKECIKHSPYRNGKDEGVVLKCYSKMGKFGNPLFAKIVDEEFKEENKKVFGKGHPKKEDYVEKILTERFFTDARFNKAINHFIDENKNISMSLMPELYKYVSDDILSEQILYISKEFQIVNFKEFSNNVARECAKSLKKYLMEK